MKQEVRIVSGDSGYKMTIFTPEETGDIVTEYYVSNLYEVNQIINKTWEERDATGRITDVG